MFPWNLFNQTDYKKIIDGMKPDEVNKYIQDMMQKVFQNNFHGMMNPDDFLKNFDFQNNQSNQNPGRHSSSPIQSSVYETHDFVFARIHIKNEEWLQQLRLYHTSNQLIIDHIPELDDQVKITLPAIVRKKGSSAHYKDGVLEIKIPKNIDMQYSEIDVTEIL